MISLFVQLYIYANINNLKEKKHVWEVSVIRRGLGESYGILGNYRLCITDTTLSLVRIGPPTTSTGERRVEHVEFALASMRRCGATHGFFYLEVGRFSTTGAGEIWMETGDQVIAENMNTIILGTAAKRNKEDNLAPMMRIRSQSANESSKPMMHRRATVTGPKPINFSPAEHSQQSVQQCDSSFSATSTCTVVMTSCLLKTNDPLTNLQEIPSPTTPPLSCDIAMISETIDDVVMSSEPSVVSMDVSANILPIAELSSISNNTQNYANLLPKQEQIQQQSQPSTSTTLLICSTSSSKNASSTTASSNVPMVCHQRALSLPSASPMLITNNYQKTNLNFINNNSQHIAQVTTIGNSAMTTGKSFAIQPIHQRTRSLPLTEENAIKLSQSPPQSFNLVPSTSQKLNNNSMETAASSRERCDSFPSIGRTRTISETSSEPPQPNQPQVIHNINNNMPPPSKIPGRTQSMYNRYNSSQSPPVNSSPLSPPSGAYSTEESGGSSISIDEVDGFGRTPEEHNGFNYNSFSSKVPIPEENESYWYKKNNNNYGHTKSGASLSLPYMQSQSNQRRGSPNPPTNTNEPYMDMCPYSPCSSSPGDAMGNNYMPMSPGVDFRGGMYTSSSGAHSRASSLTEDNDGYVPMQPTAMHEEMLSRIQNAADEINRVQSNSQLTKIMNADMSSATSSCSITSGTPSTDIRFSEYHLEKVAACFTPSEDDDQLDRPLRTYSVGSKLECNSIRKPQIDRIANEHTNTRVRAFSVGSRVVKVTRAELTSRGHGSFDHMDDLMEIDFSSSRSIESVTRVNNKPIKNSLPVNIPSKSDDYMNMTGRSASKNSSVSGYVEMKPGRVQTLSEYRSMSRPITIQNQMTSSLSPTQLTINHNHNRTRYDSRDSGIVTPSSESQPTIFPFSPGSPSLKQFVDSQEQRKCLVDGSTGTIRLSEDEILEEDPRTPVPVDHSMVRKQLEILSSDYAIMNLGEPVSKKPNLTSTPVSKQSPESSTNSSAQSHFLLNPDSESHDYINCIPSATISSSKIITPKPIKSSVAVADDIAGDYALMNPLMKNVPKITTEIKTELPQNVPQTASKKSLLLQLSSQEKLNSNSCFKPIVEDQNSTTSSHHPVLCRQTSEKRAIARSSGYEILVRPSLSRPNSVNSEKIMRSSSNTSTNRPNSVNSERLGPCSISSTSSSTSTLCGEIPNQSSSNLRLMEMSASSSAVASPMSLTSRPESVSSDILMTSRPPSVSDRSELHYASLDLPPCSNIINTSKMDIDDSKMDLSSSPSSNAASSSSSSASSQQSQHPAFSYAQIDFVQSENLKAANQHQQQ
ncbi:unnamed protein product [Diamesa serratosioi]